MPQIRLKASRKIAGKEAAAKEHEFNAKPRS
jgi:hypothetical protein